MSKHILGELSNTQINQYLDSYSKYQGCFSCLQLPKIKNGFYVVNLDNFNLNGTHWLSVWVTPKTIYYCDPFGQIPNSQTFKWMLTGNKKIYYNTRQLQELKSDACGYFACFIGIQLLKNHKTFIQVMSMFSDNTKVNQNMLKRFFKL